VASGWRSLCGAGTRSLTQLKENHNNTDITQQLNQCGVRYLLPPQLSDTYIQANQGNIFSDNNVFRVCHDVEASDFSPCYSGFGVYEV
jgi:hypothetical protein